MDDHATAVTHMLLPPQPASHVVYYRNARTGWQTAFFVRGGQVRGWHCYDHESTREIGQGWPARGYRFVFQDCGVTYKDVCTALGVTHD